MWYFFTTVHPIRLTSMVYQIVGFIHGRPGCKFIIFIIARAVAVGSSSFIHWLQSKQWQAIKTLLLAACICYNVAIDVKGLSRELDKVNKGRGGK